MKHVSNDFTSNATPFLLITPAFCLGIIAAGMEANYWFIGVLLVVGLIVAGLFVGWKSDFRAAICIMFAGLGFLNGSIQLNFESGVPIGQRREFVTHVQTVPEVKGRYQNVEGDVLWMKDTVLGWQLVDAKCLVSVDTAFRIRVGDYIRYGARSYGFDSVLRTYYFSQGLSARHYVYGGDVLGGDSSFMMRVEIFRDAISQRINGLRDVAGVDGEAVAVMQALMVGDKKGLDRELKGSYRAAGASHLLAISGLHVGIIFGVINFLMLGLRLVTGGRWISFGVAMVVLWGYALVSGMSASVVRAVVMFSFVQVGLLMGQRSGLNVLLIAAFLMLVYRAEYLWDVGFGLSYLAMFGILVLYRPLLRLWWPRNYVVRLFWQVLVVSFSAQLFTLPLVGWVFGEISLVGLGVNLLVWISVPVIIVSGMAYVISGWWVFGYVGGVVARLQNLVMEWVGDLRWSTVDIGDFSGWWLVVIYSALLVMCVWVSWRRSVRNR